MAIRPEGQTDGATSEPDPQARLKAAASAADVQGILTAAAEEHALDGLYRYVRGTWPDFSDEADDVVGESVDALVAAAVRRERVPNPVGFMLKVAYRKCRDRARRRRTETSLSGEEASSRLDPGAAMSGYDEPAENVDSQRIRFEAIRLLRAQILNIGQTNVVSVMSYVLEAAIAGRDDVTNAEISEGLGLSSQAVRTALSRGRERLFTRAVQAGLVTDRGGLNRFWAGIGLGPEDDSSEKSE